VQEPPGDHQASDISGQHGFAAGLGGQPADSEQDNKQQLDLRLGYPVPEVPDGESEQAGEGSGWDGADGQESQQQPVVAGKQAAEGQHRAEVRDEAGGEDELAEVVPVQAGLGP
jgi:hypothetical protein